MVDDGKTQKQRLRDAVRHERARISTAEHAAAREGLTTMLQALVNDLGAQSVTCYLPRPGEPDTRGFLEWAELAQIDTLLPSAREDGLLDWIRPSGDGTVKGAFGIDEPLGEVLSPLAAGEVDLMIVPAAAVDLSGNRLGWGKGYYDRGLGSMSKRPPVFAVVHEHEVIESLPFDEYDVPVSGVVTPERIVRFA